MTSPRAGQPAAPEDLVDVAALVAAYYELHPDPADAEQRVGFGTSGHRGSSLDDDVQRGPHRRDQPGDLRIPRAPRASTGRCSSARTPTRCPSRRPRRALEVFAANGVTVLIDSRDGYTPTPAVSRAILRAQRGPLDADCADGVVVTPSHNPPQRRRVQVQPAATAARPAPTSPAGSRTAPTSCSPTRLTGVRRVPHEQALAADTTRRYDFLDAYVDALPSVVDLDAIRAAGVRIGADPLGGASVDVLGRDRRAVRARPDRREPDRRPDVRVHDPGLGRQDPDGLLVAVGDGVADRPAGRLRHRDRQRHRRRPARHRHARRRADEPEPLPRRRDPLPLRAPRRLAGRRPRSARRW